MKKREVRRMTMEQIKALPNMLGVLASIECERHGFYNCEIGSTPTRIEVQQ